MMIVEAFQVDFVRWLDHLDKDSLPDIANNYVERQNLTMRMHVRRFIRLTNALARNSTTTSLRFACISYYNFVRIHQTLRITSRRPWPAALRIGCGSIAHRAMLEEHTGEKQSEKEALKGEAPDISIVASPKEKPWLRLLSEIY